jgi:hypothetical protein
VLCNLFVDIVSFLMCGAAVKIGFTTESEKALLKRYIDKGFGPVFIYRCQICHWGQDQRALEKTIFKMVSDTYLHDLRVLTSVTAWPLPNVPADTAASAGTHSAVLPEGSADSSV